jgi:hypothetical protein
MPLLIYGLGLNQYFVDHLVETNDYVADILSVMIGKQHHVLVSPEKGPYKNPTKKYPNVLVLPSREFSTAFKAVEELGLILQLKTRYRTSKWTNSLLAMPFFSHQTVSSFVLPRCSQPAHLSCRWLGRPPSLVQLMTTYVLF